LSVPAVEQRQLAQQHERLHRVEPGGVALEFVPVLRALPVLAERDDDVGEPVVVRDECAGVAGGAEVFPWIEGECGRDAGRPGAEAVARGAVSPAASNASLSASRPLLTPTQRRTPQYAANRCSNSATAGPFVNAPESSRWARSPRISAFRSRCCGARSRNGTFATGSAWRTTAT